MDCQRLEAEKQKFHAAIDTLDSALVRLEQLWISNVIHPSFHLSFIRPILCFRLIMPRLNVMFRPLLLPLILKSPRYSINYSPQIHHQSQNLHPINRFFFISLIDLFMRRKLIQMKIIVLFNQSISIVKQPV